MSGCPDFTMGALVLWEIGAYMVGELTLVASRDKGKGGGIRYDNRLNLSSGFHNHL